LSFSESRIPHLAQYVSDYLKQSFWIYNIEYYDFREHKRFHYLNEPAICEEIDINLADSDIFVRFIGEGLEPNKTRLIKNQISNIRFNPYTGSLSSYGDNFTYYDYEVDTSYDRFGFNNPFNRFQIVSESIMVSPMPHIQTIFIDSDESALDFALRIIGEFTFGYWQYRRRSNILW
jgi:hypothetical protein